MEYETKEYLEKAYWEEGKTLKEIGHELGITPPAVFAMFEKYGIRTRTIKKAVKLWWKKKKEQGLA